MEAQFLRYGFSANQRKCVGGRIGATLSGGQLRKLEMKARSFTKGASDSARLTPGDLLFVSSQLKDPLVAIGLNQAASMCGVTTVELVQGANGSTAERTAAPSKPVSVPEPTASAEAARITWISLGAAPTGQPIAVDATSLKQEGAFRSGWFRLAKAGERNANSYLLRVDCTAQTINSMELRKHGPNGEITEQRSYGPNGEGAVPARDGTVLEIAFLSLCS
jgi:hypothetical protein